MTPPPAPPSPTGAPAERWLDRLEAWLRSRRDPNGAWSRTLRWARRLSWAACWLYAAGVWALLGAAVAVGEQATVAAVALLLPATLWVGPAVALAVPAWALDRRQLAVLAAGALAPLLLLGEWRWGGTRPPPEPGRRDLSVVTNNIGQNNKLSLRPFLAVHEPDLLLLQEAGGRAPAYARDYPGFHVKGVHEFLLLSRFPIREGLLVEGVQPYAARFVVELPEGPLAVYNVHLLSPRRALDHLRGRAFLLPERHEPLARLLGEHRQVLETLRARWAREEWPWIAGGDFNTVGPGFHRRLLAEHARDAHRDAGEGFGLTFPGETSNPLSLFGPWLRIDYLWGGRGWTPVYCRTEGGRASQHRAVAAVFRSGPADRP